VRRSAAIVSLGAVILGFGSLDSRAEPAEESKKDPRWSNSTELSVVVLEGNSSSSTLGLKNTLRRNWERSRFQFKIDGVRTDKADDRFLRADPGIAWEPGSSPPDPTLSLIVPSPELDTEIYLVQARYDSKVSERLTWNVGGSWDRNTDAGILSRYILFGGFGHVWWKRDDFKFLSSYGLSFNDRLEETPDPEKDERFAGVRFDWDYLNDWGKVTTYENDFTFNMSIKDPTDYWLDMTNAISVHVSEHLSLKVSLQWLYNNEPGLEDVDAVARVDLVDPDGIPGSGDELFVTVDSGGTVVELGTEQVRRDRLDQIFRTTLVVKF